MSDNSSRFVRVKQQPVSLHKDNVSPKTKNSELQNNITIKFEDPVEQSKPEKAIYETVFFRYEGDKYGDVPYCTRCERFMRVFPDIDFPFQCAGCGHIATYLTLKDVEKIMEVLNPPNEDG
ncbi:MAG: hypothetical protein FWE64_03960 [Alphaproteobacteria bacterium]|nr:hypothetical protein [Alphaproteobacteria bacterium]